MHWPVSSSHHHRHHLITIITTINTITTATTDTPIMTYWTPCSRNINGNTTIDSRVIVIVIVVAIVIIIVIVLQRRAILSLMTAALITFNIRQYIVNREVIRRRHLWCNSTIIFASVIHEGLALIGVTHSAGNSTDVDAWTHTCKRHIAEPLLWSSWRKRETSEYNYEPLLWSSWWKASLRLVWEREIPLGTSLFRLVLG